MYSSQVAPHRRQKISSRTTGNGEGVDGAVGFCVRGFPIRGPPPLGQVAGSTPVPPINFRSQVTDRACLPTTSGGLRPPPYHLRSRFPLGPAIYKVHRRETLYPPGRHFGLRPISLHHHHGLRRSPKDSRQWCHGLRAEVRRGEVMVCIRSSWMSKGPSRPE